MEGDEDRDTAPGDPDRRGVESDTATPSFPEREAYLLELRSEFENGRLDLNEYVHRAEAVKNARSATEATEALGALRVRRAGQPLGTSGDFDRHLEQHEAHQLPRASRLTYARVWIIAVLALLWLALLVLYLTVPKTH